MLLDCFWVGMIAVSLVWGMLTGQGKSVLPALLDGTSGAISVALKLTAGYLFFCGLMNIVNNLKTLQTVEKKLRPMLHVLFGGPMPSKTAEAVSLNIAANLLGLGNAATPSGIKAAGLLAEQGNRHGLYMLLILNATSIQLLPTTVLTLRIAAGSAEPNAILLPTLLATTASTVTGCGLGFLCRKAMERRHDA